MDQPTAVDAFVVEETSHEFLGQWQRLVSTTNWEKGRIISDWRAALQAASAPATEYSDEAWSRRVGNVSGQHVGRLRRVYERFGAVCHDFNGLFWSHFQAALDWSDAEMWLEGAVQSQWSVSQMRFARWEVMGKPADQEPRPDEVVSAELDEDAPEATDLDRATPPPSTVRDVPGGPDFGQGPDFGDEAPSPDQAAEAAPWESSTDESDHSEPAALVRPFAELPPLPDDLQQAFEALKLALLRHKLAGWTEIARDDLLAYLEGLKQLALAPSAE